MEHYEDTRKEETQNFFLGQKVKFDKFIKRTGNTGFNENYDDLTESEKSRFDDGPFFVKFQEAKSCKETEGLIVGKRNLIVGSWFSHEEQCFSYDGETQCQSVAARENRTETIYLVACNLRGFRKVFPEDLKVI